MRIPPLEDLAIAERYANAVLQGNRERQLAILAYANDHGSRWTRRWLRIIMRHVRTGWWRAGNAFEAYLPDTFQEYLDLRTASG